MVKNRLYISTIASDASQVAKQYGLGLEIADFCMASNMDVDFSIYDSICREHMASSDRFWFHAPFAELSPASIDPKVRQISMERYLQAVEVAAEYGINKLVIHAGFIPRVYYPQWFISSSVTFWKEFFRNIQRKDITIAIENVMEQQPSLLTQIVEQVDDPRLQLCLDIGHAHVSSRDALQSWVESMAPWLCHVHLHDNLGEEDQHLPLGMGNIPMEAVLDTIIKFAPRASFTIENMHCEESVRWLTEKGYIRKENAK